MSLQVRYTSLDMKRSTDHIILIESVDVRQDAIYSSQPSSNNTIVQVLTSSRLGVTCKPGPFPAKRYASSNEVVNFY